MQYNQPRPLTYSINNAAFQLSISRASIYRLIAQKKLDLRKVGNRSVVTASSVMKLIGEAA
jgi:excisionase family DNA binding protein